jgi:hypothetical protein
VCFGGLVLMVDVGLVNGYISNISGQPVNDSDEEIKSNALSFGRGSTTANSSERGK